MSASNQNDDSAPFRVLAITPTGVFSGAERVLLAHARRGRSLGDHWTIAAPDGVCADRIEADGIARLRVPELKLDSGPRLFAAFVLLLRQLWALRLVRRELSQADIVVANSVMCLPLLRVARCRAPVVWLVHDVITRTDLRRLAQLTVGAVDEALPVSNAAGELARQLGVPVKVIRNGVDVAPVAPIPPTVDPPIVGLNGVLTHWKGQHVLLEAAARTRHRFVVELLGGALPKDGPYEEALRDRAQQEDLAGRVKLLGHQEDTASVMGRWAVAVSASVEPEAGPLAVLEAMALGRPVVVTDHGGAPEVVDGAGVIVPPDDPTALADAIELGDVAEIRRGIEQVDARMGQVQAELGRTGGLSSRLEELEARTEERRIATLAEIGEARDVDAGEAVLRLRAAEASYEATLAAVGRSFSPSLIDFLR